MPPGPRRGPASSPTRLLLPPAPVLVAGYGRGTLLTPDGEILSLSASELHAALRDGPVPPMLVHGPATARRLDLPRFDAAFSVLPHIHFPPATTVVALRFDGRVSSTLYEDCAALEEVACAVRRAAFVLHGPALASFSSLPAQPGSGDGAAPGSDVSLSVQWLFSADEACAPRVPRLCEGLKAVPLPALTELSVALTPFSEFGNLSERDDVARLRRLWESVPTVERLEVGVHPAQAKRVFASLGARASEEPPPGAPENDGGEAGEHLEEGEEGGEKEEATEEEGDGEG